jgi:sugar transferase (PEP-CTERM/EpsH1 system associated)
MMLHDTRSAPIITRQLRPFVPSPDAVRVIHVVYALQSGGMELGVLKLVNAINPQRVRSSICSTRAAGKLKQMTAPGVRVFELHGRKGNDPGLIWTLYRLFRRERPDIVHTHAWGTLVEGLVAARWARVPAVIHGEHGTMRLRWHQKLVQRRAWSNVDQVLSVSTRLAERMAAEVTFPLEKIRTIKNGVDLSRFGRMNRRDAREALGVPADGLTIGTVGRLVAVKDHFSLIEGVARLRQSGLTPLMLIAGDGPLKNDIAARAAALGIASQVKLLGHKSDVEVVLAALDAFVLSSLSEGLSNTILEAMASAVPVVATRVGGADELIDHGVNGLLVPPAAPAEIAAALALLLKDGTIRASMAAAGRERVETRFSLAEMVKQYEALYIEVSRARRSAVPRAVTLGAA